MMKNKINELLKAFKIKGEVVNVVTGTRIMRYEVQLDITQKVNKLKGITAEIALHCGFPDQVMINEIAGKPGLVGIEMPNTDISIVDFNESINSDSFKNASSPTSFIVGNDIDGNTIVGDVKKLPHMLVAGTTGSGKSVFLNNVIMSLLHKSSPQDVRLIMVDPKHVEMANYSNVPHLLCPIIKDADKALSALNWAVEEMHSRYAMFAELNVRDYDSYREKVKDNYKPIIVIVIDEMADLMMESRKSKIDNNSTEDLIVRLTQKARAAGIHLILATQYPKAEVITGLIKANLKAKAAFYVSERRYSNVILDRPGAENLLGDGDMLFDDGKITRRLQGAFVSDDNIIEFVDTINVDTPEFDEGLMSMLDGEKVSDNIYNVANIGSKYYNAADAFLDEIQAKIDSGKPYWWRG